MKTLCALCFHHCWLDEGQTGLCRARGGRDGRIVPLHLSRFFPRYRMADRPPTSVKKVYRLADEAKAYLTYVYTGNC